MLILNVNEKCNGCGGCLETDYFEETSEGFAKAKEGIIISKNDTSLVHEIIENCPCDAIDLIEDGKGEKDLKHILEEAVNKLKSVENIPEVNEDDIEFNPNCFLISIDHDFIEDYNEYHSYDSAFSHMRSEFYPIWNMRETYAYDAFQLYIKRDLRRYWSDTEENSVYYIKKKELADILNTIKNQLTSLGVKSIDFEKFTAIDIKLDEYAIMSLCDSEQAAKSWAGQVAEKMDKYGGINSILHAGKVERCTSYKDTLFGNTKEVTRWMYDGCWDVRDKFIDTLLHDMQFVAKLEADKKVNAIINSFNKELDKFVDEHVQQLEQLYAKA